MTVVPELPTPYSDEVLRLIGAIAVESARLESQLFGLRALLRGADATDYRDGHQKAAKECRERANDLGGVLGPEVSTAIGSWAESASALLKERGDLMHSTWILDEGNVLTSVHLKSDARVPVELTELHDLATRLRQHVEDAMPTWTWAVLGADLLSGDRGAGGTTSSNDQSALD